MKDTTKLFPNDGADSKIKKAPLTKDEITFIDEHKSIFPIKEIARHLNVTSSYIGRILKKKYKKDIETVDLKTGEVWKSIIMFDGFYMVSNLGRIKSIKRHKPHIYSPYKNSRG